MKSIKIKRFSPKSVLKSVLIAIAIPYIIFIILMVSGMIIGRLSNGVMSESVNLSSLAINLLLMPIIYGLVFMLFATSYNWLAPKFGGLELLIEDAQIEKEAPHLQN